MCPEQYDGASVNGRKKFNFFFSTVFQIKAEKTVEKNK